MKTLILLLFSLLLPCIANSQWVRVSPSSSVGNLAVKDTFLFALSYGTIFRSSDNGASWTEGTSVSYNNPWIGSLAVSDNNIFVLADGGGIYKSTDNGESWLKMGYVGIQVISELKVFGKYIFAGGNGGVFRSMDSAKSWNKSDTGMPYDTYVYCFAISGTTLYSGISGGLYRSLDSGTSWNKINTGIRDPDIFRVGISPPNFYAGAGSSGLFNSNDNGGDWVATSLTNTVVYSFAFFGTDVFVSTDIQGINLSTDYGSSWIDVNSGLTSVAGPLIVYHDYLFTSAGGSVWRRPLSEMIPASVPSSNQPSTFHLAQNYPNPFSSITTIPFDLPERTFVSLKVYDITGREVAVLANETLDAGSHSRTFNAEGLPSGTYVARLEAGVYREAKTIQVLR
jgi:hypothetical protein